MTTPKNKRDAAPIFTPRFTAEGLDGLIDLLVGRTVKALRERQSATGAAQKRPPRRAAGGTT